MPNRPPFFVRFSLTRGLIPNINGIYPQGHVIFFRIQPMALLREGAMTRAILQDMWGRRLRDFTIVNIGLTAVVLLEDPTLELLKKLIDILLDTLFKVPARQRPQHLTPLKTLWSFAFCLFCLYIQEVYELTEPLDKESQAALTYLPGALQCSSKRPHSCTCYWT